MTVNFTPHLGLFFFKQKRLNRVLAFHLIINKKTNNNSLNFNWIDQFIGYIVHS